MVYMLEITSLGDTQVDHWDILFTIIGLLQKWCAEVPSLSVKNWAVPVGQVINSSGPSLEEGRVLIRKRKWYCGKRLTLLPQVGSLVLRSLESHWGCWIVIWSLLSINYDENGFLTWKIIVIWKRKEKNLFRDSFV